MNCPHCASAATTRRQARTTLGYRRFNCRSCKRRFNERTGTPFNHLQVATDVVLLAVLWRLRYKLSFRDVAEMLLQRGVEVTHETIREWDFRFAPLLAGQLRAKRRARAGESWYLDETYVKVAGRWCYLYRAIDGDGELIDSMLSERRDKHAARRFLRRLVEITERKPARITTDLHPRGAAIFHPAHDFSVSESAARLADTADEVFVPHRLAANTAILCYLRTDLHGSSFAVPRPLPH